MASATASIIGEKRSWKLTAALSFLRRAIARMRRELDQLEGVAVRRARNANATWQLIALALGVSKQAVHKKYGRR